jgi:hypothetical protein
MTEPKPSVSDAELDRALAQLPSADLPQLAGRAQLKAAERRLQRARASHWVERYEPPLLAAFAAAHLVWALVQIFDSSPR